MFTGIVTVKLSLPLKMESKEINEIVLDFGKVNGVIIKECEKQTFMSGNLSGIMRNLSSDYCSRMASLISGVPNRTIEKLSGYDFEKVWQTVGAYVGGNDPKEFYDQFTEDEDDGEKKEVDFSEPPQVAGKPKAESAEE
jgi:hypothetical protein